MFKQINGALGGPTKHSAIYDLVEHLEQKLVNVEGGFDKERPAFFRKSPHIIASIFDIPIPMLIDIGSQVTCIAESFYQYLSANGRVPTLPISNVMLVPAIKRKKTSVKDQAFHDLEIGSCKITVPFLIIPKLGSNVILGNDWLMKNKVILVFDDNLIKINGYSLPYNLIRYGDNAADQINSSYEDDVLILQIVRVDDQLIKNKNEVTKKNGQRF